MSEEGQVAKQAMLIRLIGGLMRRDPSISVSGDTSRLHPAEDCVETALLVRVFRPDAESDLEKIVCDSILKTVRMDWSVGLTYTITSRVRNMVAATVAVDPRCLGEPANCMAWSLPVVDWPCLFHGVVIGALEGLVQRNESGLILPDEPGLVGSVVGSALANFPSEARRRSWPTEMKRVINMELEQSLGQLVAKVIEAFGDPFVFAFLRPFTSFEGGFPESDLVGFVEQVVRQVTIKYLARRPTPALLQLCTGSLATEQR